MKHRFYFFAVLACLLLVYIVTYHDLLTGKKVFIHDTIIWYGGYQYIVDTLSSGNIPYWDPYMLGGTPFYPHMSFGALDPLLWISTLFVKITGIPILTSYIYFFLARLGFFVFGAYLFYSYITGCRLSALIASGILFYFVGLFSYSQGGNIGVAFYVPMALYISVKLFDNLSSQKHYLYFTILTILTGLSMTIFIPVYYLFNLIVFWLMLIVFRRREFLSKIGIFRKKRVVALWGAGVLVVILMTVPSLAVYHDAAGSGELFPLQRMSAHGVLQKIIASDIHTHGLSGKYSDGMRGFLSYGDILYLVFHNVHGDFPFFLAGYLSEMPLMTGIIAFVMALIGLMFFKSRYRVLLVSVFVIVFIISFGFSGISTRLNFVQKVFDFIFPPLKMIHIAYLFGSCVMFYLGAFISMGLSIIFHGDKSAALLRSNFRQILSVVAAILVFKAAITWFFAGRVLFSSRLDMFAVLLLVFFFLMTYATAKGLLPVRVFSFLIVVAILSESFVLLNLNKHYLMDSSFMYEFTEAGRSRPDGGEFQYFKNPINGPPGLAFGESILKSKGVLSYVNNHIMLSTKRYYDLISHLPMANQLAISGVLRPVVRFFPHDAVTYINDKPQLLEYLSSEQPENLLDSLFIEDPSGSKSLPGRRTELGATSEYETIPIIDQYNVSKYLSERWPDMESARRNIYSFLNTPSYSVSVTDFSINDVAVTVDNLVDGYLLYNDGWSKYWEAYDGERRLPVMIANYNSKAVFLPKGRHNVKFVFNPVPYKIGLLLCISALMASCLFMLVLFFRRNREPYEEDRKDLSAD